LRAEFGFSWIWPSECPIKPARDDWVDIILDLPFLLLDFPWLTSRHMFQAGV
jgi:hypothetical protein